MATNKQVLEAFTRYETASSGNLSTKLGVLYSYDKIIAAMQCDIAHIGMFTAADGGFVSATTSQHVTAALRVAKAQGCIIEKMNPDLAEEIFECLRNK